MSGLEALDIAPIADRMRYAADVLVEATTRYQARRCGVAPEYVDWRPINLRSVAKQFEAEEKAAAEREDRIEWLARAMFDAFNTPHMAAWEECEGAHPLYLDAAKSLIESGWTKDHIVDAEVVTDTTDQEN